MEITEQTDRLRNISTAFLSVFNKSNLEKVVSTLSEGNVKLYASGGTSEFIRGIGLEVIEVSELTSFPEILGGRVKTLHPTIFGAILAVRDNQKHRQDLERYSIPFFDVVIVDLYPFQEAVLTNSSHNEIIEKIDIGGVSLIRAAAKNFLDVLVIPSEKYFDDFVSLLQKKDGISLSERRKFAQKAFELTTNYDLAISSYLKSCANVESFKDSTLKYGENPHQKAYFTGDVSELFEKISEANISYNNLLDIDSGLRLIADFNSGKDFTLAILKHTVPCGIATRSECVSAWEDALACDPTSAFGGVIVLNKTVSLELAERIDKVFYEVLAAIDFEPAALELLTKKKQRKVIKIKPNFAEKLSSQMDRTCLNGILTQNYDPAEFTTDNYRVVTDKKLSGTETEDILFAEKVVKHLKSNAIAIVKNKQLIGSGTGQTSRIDSMQQALDKSRLFGFDLKGSVLASDGFFPFPDIVKMASENGISALLQPGGSKNDDASIKEANNSGISMVFTGIRRFRH